MDTDTARLDCPFCIGARAQSNNKLAYSTLDQNPVTIGHTLVILRRHKGNLLDATTEEWRDVWELVRLESERILAKPEVDGLNIGVNIGVAAGQTVDHAHVHIIPRTMGDHADPSGGVRHVMDQC